MAVEKQAEVQRRVRVTFTFEKHPNIIARCGEKGRQEAGVQEKLAELRKAPSKKKFELFLMQAKETIGIKGGKQIAEEMGGVLLALDHYDERRAPAYGTLGEIIDNIFSVYGHERIARVASSLQGTGVEIVGTSENLLFLMCMCSRNGDAAKHAFVELRNLYRTYEGTRVLEESFEKVAGNIADGARSNAVAKMAENEFAGRGFFGSRVDWVKL